MFVCFCLVLNFVCGLDYLLTGFLGLLVVLFTVVVLWFVVLSCAAWAAGCGGVLLDLYCVDCVITSVVLVFDVRFSCVFLKIYFWLGCLFAGGVAHGFAY